MAKNSYGRSLSWYLSFFGLPVVAFALMLAEVCHWENPIWGPLAREKKASAAKQALEAKSPPGESVSQQSQKEGSTPEESHESDPEAGANTTGDAANPEVEGGETENARIEAEQAKSEREDALAAAEKQEKRVHSAYRLTTAILVAVGMLPYLALLLRLTERLRITDKAIRQVRLYKNRRIIWDNLIECRDFLNYIHLVPTDRSSEMYIDYYQTFRRHEHLWRRITRKSRDVEANMMVGRRRGRVASCDLGLVPSLLFVTASAAMLILFRQRIILLGVLSGMVLALAGAWAWITTRLSPRRWKSGGYLYVMLFALSLILPPAYFAQDVSQEGKIALVSFGALYFVGLLAGSGLMSMLLPSRKRR
jgi:hypothetical protein